jgi:hypothetical protein
MSDKKTGGPAFPTEPRSSVHGKKYDGMTLRDWFAGQALAGLLAQGGSATWERDAENAYQAADAMIAARETPHD